MRALARPSCSPDHNPSGSPPTSPTRRTDDGWAQRAWTRTDTVAMSSWVGQRCLGTATASLVKGSRRGWGVDHRATWQQRGADDSGACSRRTVAGKPVHVWRCTRCRRHRPHAGELGVDRAGGTRQSCLAEIVTREGPMQLRQRPPRPRSPHAATRTGTARRNAELS